MDLVAVLVGIFISGVVTAFVFLFGGAFIAGPTALAILFVIGTLIMPLAIRLFWRIFEVFPEDRKNLGMLVPIPLMFISVLIIFSQPMLLRGLGLDGTRVMSAWLIWVCACGLVAAARAKEKAD
ncbi:MAG: DUF5367 family protein [Hyphomicrobiales bacterium]|nr:DUF5367 family protein [Hyphomicrobiales bacterium]